MRRSGQWAAVVAATLAVVGFSASTALAQPQPRSEPATPLPHVKVINLHHAYAARLGHTKLGKISGIVYALGHQPKVARKATTTTCTEPNCPLIYNGGPVQHTPHVYLLLWGPNWTSDPVLPYLENFYAGLGVQPQDNWSTITSQYGDGSGFPTFTGSVYEGAYNDTSTPPSGTTDAQFAAEADAFASDLGLTDLTDAQIVIATPSGTCPSGFYAPGCAGGTGNYCAYHDSSNGLPFTNLPYLLDSGIGCGENFINAGSAGIYDGFSMIGGHEYAESVTDPLPPSGWVDQSDPYGGEIGDKCVWGGHNWGGNDPYGDVTLSSGSFAMQSLWSNNANGCAMSATVGKPIKGYGGKCLDDAGGKTTNGNKIDIYSCNGSAAQDWTFSGGKLSVLGSCLSDRSYTGAGTKLVLWSCIGHKNELWTHHSNGEYVLANGLCLTDPSDSVKNGTQVEIRGCADNRDQRWSLP